MITGSCIMRKYVLLYISDKIKKLYRYRIVLRNLLSHWHLINFTEWLGKFFKRRQEDFAISKGWCTTYTLIPGKTKRQGSRDKKDFYSTWSLDFYEWKMNFFNSQGMKMSLNYCTRFPAAYPSCQGAWPPGRTWYTRRPFVAAQTRTWKTT